MIPARFELDKTQNGTRSNRQLVAISLVCCFSDVLGEIDIAEGLETPWRFPRGTRDLRIQFLIEGQRANEFKVTKSEFWIQTACVNSEAQNTIMGECKKIVTSEKPFVFYIDNYSYS